MKRRELLPSEVTPNTIIRLAEAARLAFPDGSITVTSLRCEAQKGHLTIWRIAGKDMTSLAEIELMKDRCRVKAKALACGSGTSAGTPMDPSSSEQDGLSLMEAGITPQDAFRMKLLKRKESSPSTSRSERRSRRPVV